MQPAIITSELDVESLQKGKVLYESGVALLSVGLVDGDQFELPAHGLTCCCS